MNLAEVFKNRRPIRNYQEKSISSDIIQSLLNDSILAPSAGNEQPWKFIIVSNREMIKRIPGIPHRREPQILTECKQKT